jgi:hypothetical protein
MTGPSCATTNSDLENTALFQLISVSNSSSFSKHHVVWVVCWGHRQLHCGHRQSEQGLKDSTGATAEYEAAVDFLDGLKTTLEKLKEHLDSYPDTFHAKDIGEQAERLKAAVEKFKVKTEKFEASLASDWTRSSIRRAPRKIQWTLFADSVRVLQKAISQPQNVLNTILLLQTL